MNPVIIRGIFKGAMAIVAFIASAIAGKTAGEKHSDYREKKRKQKLDEEERERHNRFRRD